MKKWFLMLALGVCLSGCGNADFSPKPMESYEAADIDVEKESESQKEEETPGDSKDTMEGLIILPDEFEFFDDDRSHRVRYYSDVEYSYYDDFTMVSRPDLGIESVAFRSCYTDVSEEELYSFGNNDQIIMTSEEDARRVYDRTTASYLKDKGYSRYIPADGIVGIINTEGALKGEAPTIDEINGVARQYNLMAFEPVFCDTTRDGKIVYTTYCASIKEETEEDIHLY